MASFSQIIDAVITETFKPDRKPVLVSGLNQTIRELHSSDVSTPIGYADNLVEASLIADSETGYTFQIPSPMFFQKIEAVFYWASARYATMRSPSSLRAMVDLIGGGEYGYYRTGNSIAFENYGGLNAEISLAWFEYLPGLAYYKPADRPAWFDYDTQTWKYHANYDINDATRQQALNLSTNWMCFRHTETLKEGARAKLYKSLGDEVRMRTAYSAFEKARKDLIAAEEYTGPVIYRK